MRENRVRNYLVSRLERLKARRKFQILPPGRARAFTSPANDNPQPTSALIHKILLYLFLGLFIAEVVLLMFF